jgi:hypothetical protein
MFAGMSMLDLAGMLVSFILTVLVLLYAFEDNALFRLAVYLFIGVAAGYAGAVALKDVLLPRLFSLEYMQMLIVILWIVLLLMKVNPRTAKIGNPAAGLLVGVGAAIAVGGAIQGTLIPLIRASGDYFVPPTPSGGAGVVLQYLFQGSVVLVGTVATLAHFHFGAKPAPNQIPTRNRAVDVISKIGQGFIAVTFGVIFAGIYSAALTALIERLSFLLDVITVTFGF